jgi:DNA-binding NarL/FixJ family response regulator
MQEVIAAGKYMKASHGETIMTTRVLIVEDHNLVRKGLHSLVAGMPDFEVVGEASEGKQAIRAALALLPDLILMDLSMPGMSGFDAIAQIRRRLPHVRIVVLTVSQNEEFMREALRVGADGYILKCASLEEFVLGLNTVISGRKFVSNEMSMMMVADYVDSGPAAAPRTAWQKLTGRERSILKLIAEGNTNRAAAQFLSISSKTVEKHRASLMRKLQLRNAAELIMTAIDIGLVERPAAGHRPVPGST